MKEVDIGPGSGGDEKNPPTEAGVDSAALSVPLNTILLTLVTVQLRVEVPAHGWGIIKRDPCVIPWNRPSHRS